MTTSKDAIYRALPPLLLLFTIRWFADASLANQVATVDYQEPSTLTDEIGNKADADSNIVFFHGTGDKDDEDKQEEVPDTIATISWFYDFSAAFAKSALSGDFPYELVINLKQKQAVEPLQIAKDFAGYLIVILVGVILVLIIPVVACCFCCCRCCDCCGGCGGRRKFENDFDAGYRAQHSRTFIILIFSAFLFIAIVGTVLMSLANNNLDTQLYALSHGGLNALDGIETFLNNTVKQAKLALFGKFDFTLAVFTRDLENIGFLLGQPVREYVSVQSGLEETYNKILDMEKDAIAIVALLREYDGMKKNYESKTHAIGTDFAASPLKTNLDQTLATKFFKEGKEYHTSMLALKYYQLPDVQPFIRSLDGFLKVGVLALVDQSRSFLNDVPTKVKLYTAKTIKPIIKKLSSYRNSIQKLLDYLDNFRVYVVQMYKRMRPKMFMEVILGKVADIDKKFRWQAAHTLTTMTFLADSLLLMAVVLGIFCGSAHIKPSERGVLSNCGGNFLLIGSVLALISAWFLILFTVPVFIIAAPVHTFICTPIKDPTVLDKLIDTYDLFDEKNKGNGSWLGNQLFPGKGVNIKVGKVFSVCASGGTVYTALLANFVKWDKLAKVYKALDIDREFSKFNVDFSRTKMNYTDLQDFLSKLKAITPLASELERGVSRSASALTENFESYLTKRSQDNSDSRMSEMANLLKALQTFKPKTSALNAEDEKLKSITKRLKDITHPAIGQKLSDRADESSKKLDSIGTDFSTATSEAFKKFTLKFGDRVKYVINQSTEDLISTLKTDIGVCKPLYDIYDDLLRKYTCDYIVGSLVAWVCGMGMTAVFLLLTVCMSCKLSKHLYRMEITDLGGKKLAGILNQKKAKAAGEKPSKLSNVEKPIEASPAYSASAEIKASNRGSEVNKDKTAELGTEVDRASKVSSRTGSSNDEEKSRKSDETKPNRKSDVTKSNRKSDVTKSNRNSDETKSNISSGTGSRATSAPELESAI